MNKFFNGGMNRRRFMGLMGAAGLAYGVLPPNLRASPVKSNLCWGGLAPANGYFAEGVPNCRLLERVKSWLIGVSWSFK